MSGSSWERVTESSVRFHAHSEAETDQAGQRLAQFLSAGDVVALIGDLGAGKTRFVKAIASGIGVPADEVNSPTFTLIHEYEGRLPIRHCDTYRLRSPEEFADLGLEDLFASDGIALVEWADRVEEYLPRDRIEIRFDIDSPTDRTINFVATGVRSRRILGQLP